MLNKRLNSNNYPILIEGLHCCSLLSKVTKKDRIIGLRTHNIEHEYYNFLAKETTNFFKKIFFSSEAKRLKKYERSIKDSLDYVFPISHSDALHFKEVFGAKKCFLTGAFHNQQIETVRSENYHLFHGNLTVEENINAARYIIKKIAPKTDKKFVIAGRNAASVIKTNLSNVTVISSPKPEEMYDLISKSSSCIVISSVNAGIKLKILNALSAGIPIFCNPELHIDPSLRPFIKTFSSTPNLLDQLDTVQNGIIDRKERQKKFKMIYHQDTFAMQIRDLMFG